jgi:AMIN domain
MRGSGMGRLSFSAIVMVVLFFSVPAMSPAAGEAPIITGIRVIKAADNGLGVELRADRDMVYTCYKMPQLLKVVIDFPGTAPGRPDTLYRVHSKMIDTIKVVQKSVNDVMVTRVTINLAEDADFRVEADSLNKKMVTVYFRKTALAASPFSTADAATETSKDKTIAESVAVPKNLPEPVIPDSLHPSGPGEMIPRESLTVSSIDFSLDAIIVGAGSAITDFSSFTLSGPDRLVIDIPSAKSTLGVIAVPYNHFGVARARVGMFNGKLRLVFEAGKRRLKNLKIVKTERGLKVVRAAVE